MKILIVTPRIPYPPYRGDKLKIFNMIQHLAKNHEVSVITFYETEEQLETDFSKVAELVKTGIAIKQSVVSSLFNILLGIFSRLPFQVLYYRSSGFYDRLRELTHAKKFDVIYFHLIRSTQYLSAAAESDAVKIQDFTDAVSMYLQRYRDTEKNPVKKFGLSRELNRVEKYESEIKGFDKIYVCSEKDKEFLSHRITGSSIGILQNGVNLSTFSRVDVPLEENRIIFTGNMPYFANSDAASYFCTEIMPLIRRDIPEAKIYLVGQNPPASVKALASENVIVTGFVEDISAEYCKSVVNVAPIRFGAGTLNKVLEALALGLPTVSTSIAVAGMPESIRKYIHIADTPQDFATVVVDILRNREVYTEKAKQAAASVREEFAWETILNKFEGELQELVQAKRNTRLNAEAAKESV